MKKFSDWSLTTKFLSAGILILITVSTSRFILNAYANKENAVNAFVEKARAICLTAESTRIEMEDKWTQGLFSLNQIREFMKTGEQDKILSTIPVVSAWRAAMRKAEQGVTSFASPNSPRAEKKTPPITG